MKIAIFPGHYGANPGAIDGVPGHEASDFGKDELHTIEAAVNWGIACLLAPNFSMNFENTPFFFRIFTGSLGKRISESNAWQADLGVSIHCDAFNNPSAKGFTVFHYPGSGKGWAFAAEIEGHMERVQKSVRSRGIKENSKYVILRKTKFPVCLLEVGFITNPDEEKIISTYDYQRSVAHAIYDAVMTYIQPLTKEV